ncbi:UNVERIFIED_CONTAM: Retrovirus-related Pol polyprotein from transposon TNT 1-94 [Sesamum latifolium]|uniref:Retrovirus-related Pol polyprotein from transposon TNT 1-94 n=1 Tax=Sesamum latifolium TaxID=2727402 RepID=A0AAW2WIG5_9LAMI
MDKRNYVHNPIVPRFKLTKDEGGVNVNKTYYKQVVGSLMYLTATLPDMKFAEIIDKLVAYIDSDYARDVEDKKSTLGYVFLLISGAVSWSSRKQPIVSLSTTKAEFIAVASCVCQAVWLSRVLIKLDLDHKKFTTIFCDSSSIIKLSKNPVTHGRSKHIDVHFHFLRELTKAGNVELVHCDSQDQLADIMTKPLKLDQFLKLQRLLGVCQAFQFKGGIVRI